MSSSDGDADVNKLFESSDEDEQPQSRPQQQDSAPKSAQDVVRVSDAADGDEARPSADGSAKPRPELQTANRCAR